MPIATFLGMMAAISIIFAEITKRYCALNPINLYFYSRPMLKRLVIIAGFILLMASGTVSATDNTAIQHFGVSATLGYIGESFLQQNTQLEIPARVYYAAALGSLPGLAKELSDPVFDSEDMAYNVAGALFGAWLGHHFNKYVFLGFERDDEANASAIGFKLKF